jgi:hypothetical protein
MDQDPPEIPTGETATRRVVGVVALLGSIALSLALAGAWPTPAVAPPPAVPPPAGFPIDYWDWGANRSLSSGELAQLDHLGGREVFSLCGMVHIVDGQWRWEPQGRSSAPIPGRRQHLVVRIDAAIARQMDPAIAPLLIPLLVAGCQRNRTTATIGVQLDCDVPTRRLPAYAALLRELRLALPAGTELSVTMLLDWARSRDLAELMQAIDFIVPQFYNTYLPIDPAGITPLVGDSDLERVIPRLEAVGRPYRVGLPTYEQCSLYDARGDLLRPALPLSPEQAITAGGEVQRVMRGAENVITVRFPNAVKVAGQQFEAGHRVAFACSTPAGMASRLADLRRLAPRHCGGVLLFRLPGRESTHSLSIAQVSAAATDTIRPATVVARLEPLGNQHWALIVSNQGDEDFIDFAAPARVMVQVPGAEVQATRLPGYGFAIARELAGEDGQRDGLELYLGLLRAGEVLVIEDLRIVTPDGAPPRITGVVQQNGRTQALGLR